MKLGYIVKTSDSTLPKFPESCVVCGYPHGGEDGIIEMTLKAHMSSIAFYMANIIKMGEKRHILQIPGHQKCIRRLRRDYWLRYLLLVLIALPVVIIGIMNDWNRFYGGLIVCVIGAPFIYWELTHPLPVEYDHEKGEYIFTFKNKAYAESFAALNQSRIEENR
jgi:hypothetical protein